MARAVVLRARLLLLDEPFAALDPVNRAICIEEMQDIHVRLGLTVVLVTDPPAGRGRTARTHIAVVVGGRLAAF